MNLNERMASQRPLCDALQRRRHSEGTERMQRYNDCVQKYFNLYDYAIATAANAIDRDDMT